MSVLVSFPAAPPALALALGLAACSAESGPPAYEAPRGAERVIVGLNTEITTQGRRALSIQADTAFFRTGSSVMVLTGVEGRTFAPTGLPAVIIQADSGTLESATQRFSAQGDVVARTRNGSISVRTSELVYDPATGRFRSDSASVVERGGSTERGSCFESDPLMTEWRLCRESP